MKKIIIFFNLAFPKAGTKLYGIPAYVSLLYLLFTPVLFFRMLNSRNGLLSGCIILMMLSILASLFSQIILFNYQDWGLNQLIQYSIPFSTIISYYWIIDKKEAVAYDKIFIFSFFIIAVFGILQKIVGDYTLMIPGLTANYHDAKIPDFLAHKNNMIWNMNYLKLASTYQNGNLFGVNFIMIFWVYFYHIKNSIFISVLSIILYAIICVLTASATVYFGLIISLLIYFVMNRDEITKFIFRRRLIFFMVFLIFLVILYFLVFHSYIAHLIEVRLFDRSLVSGGGRTEKILLFFKDIGSHPLEFFTGNLNPPHYPVYEVTPLATIQSLGIFPFLFFSVCLFFIIKPICKIPASIGVISYLFASLIDGGFWLPPTAFNLFFIAGYINKRFVD